MSPFPGHPVRAAEESAADHEAATDAGTEGDAHHHRRATTCAVAVFRPGGSVRVVVHDQRQVDPAGEPRLQRLGPPGEVGGEPDHSLIVIYPARRTDPHRLDPVPATQILDGTENRVFDSLRTVRWGGFLPTFENPAVLVDDPRGDLGAADVDADAQQRWRCNPRPAAARCGPESGQPSTLFLRPLSAPSMIVFSALRLNIPIIGMLISTVNV